MEILETKGYYLPFINIDQNSTLYFKNHDDRRNYFDSNGVVLANNVVKDVWNLYSEYLLHEGNPRPKSGPLSYFRFKIDDGLFDRYLYYYVYDYEVKGAGQVLYKLKLDTLQTHYGSAFQPIGEQLVLREHKDRFDANREPLIDKTLESLDVKPSIVEEVKTYTKNGCKLALVKVGGGVKDGEALSKASYFWKVYSPNPDTNKLLVNKENFELLLGWGVKIDAATDTTKKINLLFISESGGSTIVEIPQVINLGFRFGINSQGYPTLFLTSGGSSWESWYTATGDVAVSYADDQLRFLDSGRLYIILENSVLLPETSASFSVRYDAGIYETVYDHKRLFYYEPDGDYTAPFYERDLNPQAVETQQIISIPDIQMLDQKGFGSSGGIGIYIPLNKELKQIVYAVNTEINSITPSFTTTFNKAMTRVKYNDPKLLHSQFNTLFFTLQNEQIPLKLENTKNNNTIILTLNLNNSNYSKGLLKIRSSPNNIINNELYELEKVVNMNNEYATIKSEINDYIDLHSRNDQRLNELQISKAERDLVYKGIGQVVSVGGGIAAGAISGTMFAGPAGTVAGAAIGAAGGVVKGALNIAQGIQNLNQLKEEIKLQYDSKIKSLAYSLINVTGLTPDLAEKQNINKLRLFQFKLLDYEKDYLDLYFHHYGYQTLEFKVPNLRSRKYFNFIQMEFVNYQINSTFITAEIIEDIKSRFRAGVTFFHYNESDSVKIDTQKQYENYERKFDS